MENNQEEIKKDEEIDRREHFATECEKLSKCISEGIKLYAKKYASKPDVKGENIQVDILCAVLGYAAAKAFYRSGLSKKDLLHDMTTFYEAACLYNEKLL